MRSRGRLVVSPDLPLEPGRDADALALLAKYGIRSPNGIVCLPLRNPFTGEEVAGRPETALGVFCRPQDLSSVSPITKSFFEQRLTLRMPYSRAFEKLVGDANKSPAFTEDLGHTPKDSWVDLEPLDYTNNPEKEPVGPKVVLTSGTIAPGAGLDDGSAPASRAAGAKPKEGRLVAIGSATLARNEFFDYGRDIYLASVEWAAGREYAAGIGPRPVAKNALADTLSMLPRITGASLILTGLAFLGAGYVWYVRRGTRLGFILGAAVAALPLLFGILSLLFSARA